VPSSKMPRWAALATFRGIKATGNWSWNTTIGWIT